MKVEERDFEVAFKEAVANLKVGDLFVEQSLVEQNKMEVYEVQAIKHGMYFIKGKEWHAYSVLHLEDMFFGTTKNLVEFKQKEELLDAIASGEEEFSSKYRISIKRWADSDFAIVRANTTPITTPVNIFDNKDWLATAEALGDILLFNKK